MNYPKPVKPADKVSGVAELKATVDIDISATDGSRDGSVILIQDDLRKVFDGPKPGKAGASS